MEFIVSGRPIALTVESVEARLAGSSPGPLYKHAVRISGALWPIKDVFALATGMDRLDFTTKQARKVLMDLGFQVVRVQKASR